MKLGNIVLTDQGSERILEDLIHPKPVSDEQMAFLQECKNAYRISNKKEIMKEFLWLLNNGHFSEDEKLLIQQSLVENK